MIRLCRGLEGNVSVGFVGDVMKIKTACYSLYASISPVSLSTTLQSDGHLVKYSR
jgi:hypothetical protein